jgi:recombination protein RecT
MAGLRERATGDGGGGGEVARRGPTLEDRVVALESEFARAMPTGVARQMVQDVITSVRLTPKLGEAEPRSVLGAAMTAAQLGLRPGVGGQCWILPFWDNRTRKSRAQLIIGYEGFIYLAYLSNKVKDIVARPVRERDEFDITYAPDPTILHKPARGERGPIVAYYSMWRGVDGGSGFFDMTHREMCQWRDMYAPRGKPPPGQFQGPIVGPWSKAEDSDEFGGMALKTCIRRMSKFMPRSSQLATASAVDGSVRVDTSVLSQPETVSVDTSRDPLPGEVVVREDIARSGPEGEPLPPEDQDPTVNGEMDGPR